MALSASPKNPASMLLLTINEANRHIQVDNEMTNECIFACLNDVMDTSL